MFFLAIFTVLFAASPAYSLPLNCRDSQSATVSLLGGAALGAITGSGKAQRFTLPTAQAPVEQLRFANPQPIDLGKLITIAINKEYDASHLPAPCVQMEPGSLIGGWKNQSEDCLYATYYKPETAKAGDNLPIMVWVHGGSGIAGSSTAAGLDGSTLAVSQNVIVILVQYRLGAFGWLQTPSTFDEEGGIPGSDKVAGNQAVRDIVTALQQIRDIGASFGGDVNRVTLMGQSTGAQFVRTLLTTPSVQSLFSNAILVSDTQDYGPSTIDQNNLLGNLTMTSLGCDVDDIACARNKTADEIYNASSQAASDGPQVDEGIPIGTPWRPVIGTKYLPLGLEQNAAAGQGITKRIIMTTVQNEAGSMTAEAISASQPGATTLYMKNIQINITIEQALDAAFNQGRGSAAAALPQYQQTFNSSDSLRSTFEEIATDGLWRCAVQNNARNLAKAASKVWLAEWKVGATYPDNSNLDYCAEDGHVCHEDDIFLIFGTMPDTPTAAQKKLSAEIQTRYANFARGQDPEGPSGSVQWSPISTDGKDLNLLVMQPEGNSTLAHSQSPATCASDIWGDKIQFDWQLYSH